MELRNVSTLIITESFPPNTGGVAKSSHRIALMLRDELKEVIVFTFDRNSPPGVTSCYEIDGLKVCTLGPFRRDDLTLQVSGNIISGLSQENSVRIFQGFYSLSPAHLAVFYGKMLQGKSLVSVRGNDVDRGMFNPASHSQLLWSLGNADIVSCVSRELIRKCEILTGRSDIEYTPNSVDHEIFHPQPRSEELLREYGVKDQLLLGFFGELRMKKGITFLLEAFAGLLQTMPAILFVVGGVRKEDRHILDAFMRENPEASRKLRVIDYRSDLDELCRLYNLMDIVISPSLWDGMPNCILEALACEKIVLSSNAGGAKDIITHGENGFLISIHQLHWLKDAILEVASLSLEEKRKIQSAARKRVIKAFSQSMEISNLFALYDRLLRM